MSSIKQQTYLPPAIDSNRELKDFIKTYKRYLRKQQAILPNGKLMPGPGKRTKAIQEFEQLLRNPAQNLFVIQEKLDMSLLQIIDQFFSLFIVESKKTGLIQSAFRKTWDGSSLSYYIVLKEDNFKNRRKMFDFLNYYYFLQFYEKLPVYFQFITKEMLNKYYKNKKSLA